MQSPRRIRLIEFGARALAGCFVAGLAHAADPELGLVLPRGAQRGQEIAVTLYGQRLADALEIRVDRPGLRCVAIEETKPDRVRARFAIDAEAPLGSYLLQVRCASGTSGYQSFHVGALRVVDEVEPNDRREQAQALELESCVHGALDGRDEDLFRVQLAAPARVACEIEGARLADRAFDATLEWLDEQGAVLAEVDDDARGRLDPVLVQDVATAGTYYVRVRELTWSGDGRARYRLHVGTFPRPAICLPLGAPAGSTVELRWIGGGCAGATQSFAVPADAADEVFVHAQNERGVAPTPQRLVVSPHENLFEEARAAPLDPTRLVALHGVLAVAGEADDWPFQCAEGHTFALEAVARECGSPLDGVLEILDEAGAWRAGNDDGRSPDPKLSFRCPAAGIYRVRIRDLIGRGGENFAYRIEVGGAPPRAAVELGTARGRPLPTPEVARASRGAVVLEWRDQGGSPLAAIQALALPAGVTAHVPAPQRNVGWLPIVFEASADAPLASAAVRFAAERPAAEAGGTPVSEPLAFRQLVPLLRVENDRPYVVETARELGLGVIEAQAFTVEVAPPSTPLVAGGPLALDVALTRAEGFDVPVRVELLRPPNGVAAQAVVFEKGETQKRLLLEARGDAPEQAWPLVLVAEAGTPEGTRRCASSLRELRVVRPAATIAIGRARAEPGQEIALELILRPARELPPGVVLELIDLPPGITVTTPIACAPNGEQKLEVRLALAKEAPLGRHRGFRARLAVPVEGGFLEHRFGGGEIRLDAPLPPRPAENPSAPPPPARGSVANPKT